MTRVVILTAGMAVSTAILRKLTEAGIDAEVIADAEIVRVERPAPPSLEDALARVKARNVEPLKVRQERDYLEDDRRGDPQRDTAMLRREMLAREKSQRHMLKKGRGRR